MSRKIWQGPGILQCWIENSAVIVGPGDILTPAVLANLGPARVEYLERSGSIKPQGIIQRVFLSEDEPVSLTAEDRQRAEREFARSFTSTANIILERRLHPHSADVELTPVRRYDDGHRAEGRRPPGRDRETDA